MIRTQADKIEKETVLMLRYLHLLNQIKMKLREAISIKSQIESFDDVDRWLSDKQV